MVSPVDEKADPVYRVNFDHDRSSEEEGTMVDNNSDQNGGSPDNRHLRVNTDGQGEDGPLRTRQSPSQSREEAHRLDDELAMLQVERQISQPVDSEQIGRIASGTRERSMRRSRSRRDDTVDDFDIATNPLHEKAAIYKPPEHPTTNIAKIFKKIHQSSFIVRWFFYITPVVLIILIPLLLGTFLFKNASVGGVELMWFSIWLEIVWLTLWAGRHTSTPGNPLKLLSQLLAKTLPWPIGMIASLFTNNAKKWRDMAKQLEMPAAIFFWWLGIEVSFLPTMKNHHVDGNSATQEWERTMNKVLIAFFVGAILNFVEKIIIQLIAISFHLRTYQDRIDINKFQIGSLAKLYRFSKEKIAMEDSDFEPPSQPGSGTRTPGHLMESAQLHTKHAFSKFGDVAGRIAGDFTGRQVTSSHHPHQVVLALLNNTSGSQVLARRLYRTFAREETETVFSEDLRNAFENDEEADAAFTMFDKDMNGDISMEELEAVCVEIGRERKSITASLKDLDSVVGKLDDVFMFLVAVITILVFISLISTSAAGVLTSAGSAVLALSWLFSATAQEFLQSVIFVFVKHPFDVGDRVSIFGNAGKEMKGDDFFVKEISLLYTEFKKMEGHIVQAPNSYLNTIFILNQRRSGGLAEAVTITIKFGTTLEQIEQLRLRLLEFVKSEKREFQSNILTELRDITEVHSLELNVIFFYKSNWQNEGLRLARRNKFICALMVTMQDLHIEGPRMRYPGQKESFPVYLQNVPHISSAHGTHGGHPDNPNGTPIEEPPNEPLATLYEKPTSPSSSFPTGRPHSNTDATTASSDSRFPTSTHPSILRHHNSTITSTRPRGESLSQMNRRVDFSLGMKDIASGDMAGDVYEARTPRFRLPTPSSSSSADPSASSPSPSRGRSSFDRGSGVGSRGRASNDTGSRVSPFTMSSVPASAPPAPNPGRIARTATENLLERNRVGGNRNRFFGRRRGASLRERDPEIGVGGGGGGGGLGMADIPEELLRPGAAGGGAGSRLDQRIGLLSPGAGRVSVDDGERRLGSSKSSPGVGTGTGMRERVEGIGALFPREEKNDGGEDWSGVDRR
ncbi:MAG: hypothetical protein Q9165_007411 [Trypethelium subeluteriae]